MKSNFFKGLEKVLPFQMGDFISGHKHVVE
jgi:hypothetical protein